MDRRIVISGLAGLTGAMLSDSAWAKALTSTEAQAGLRDMLDDGTVAAVTRLGKTDGYWGDDLVRIPLPKPLASAQKIAKPLGLSGLFDELHLRINRGAETAAPLAKDLFHDAISQMTIKDAVGIVKGGNTSGTEYLQKTTTPRLTDAFTPIIGNALASTGAVDYLDRAVKRNKLQGVVKTDAKTYLSGYAVKYALDGLFHYIGVEEIAIRRSPAKRASDILKLVFG
ncbi:MAG TPA: DUF4197 domain-containing protein [Asticcacaulis sp.]|nr:DUF4197 domain-containing protein [Asticcacaulis sp.]